MTRFQRINLFFGAVLLLLLVAAGVRAQPHAPHEVLGVRAPDAAVATGPAGIGPV